MNEETIKDFHKIAKTMNTKVHIRIINFLKANQETTLCIAEICRQNKLNKYRGYHYIRSLNEIGITHVVEDGSRHLVFLDYDRLRLYEDTAKYLSANMKPRTKQIEKQLYG